MTFFKRNRMRRTLAILAVVAGTTGSAAAGAFDWAPYREDSTIEILTVDPDGSPRKTRIWIVVLDESGYVRTNDSKWLENIRRDPAVRLRTRGVASDFVAAEVDDPVVFDRVEAAFKEKYGLMQKFMSAFRMSRPTLLRISPPAPES